MPPGGASPALDSPLTVIFHNIPYANLECGRKPGHFGYPIGVVKEIAPPRGLRTGAASAQFHG
jgi:hypothetical protein